MPCLVPRGVLHGVGVNYPCPPGMFPALAGLVFVFFVDCDLQNPVPTRWCTTP